VIKFLRKARGKFGIAAPRLSVRPHIAWYLRWSMMLPFLLATLGLVWFAYNSGLELAGFYRGQTERELSALHEKVASLSDENAQLGKKVAQYEQQIQMGQGRSEEIARQLKNLNDENMRLQDDLNFFQNLTAQNGKEGELAIHRLSLERDKMPGEYRVRMLLVQSGQRAKEFIGNYEIVATILQNGRKVMQLFPSAQSGDKSFQLDFRYYMRLEQGFKLPPDVQLLNIQVRLFEHGVSEPRARQSVNLN
jgi:hypothetical protein